MLKKKSKFKILNSLPIIPMGSSCILAHNLKKNNLSKANFGFEWVNVFYLEAIIKILETNYNCFLNLENCSYNEKMNGVYDNYLQIFSLHDFTDNSQYEKDHEKVRNKYLIRLNKLKNVLENEKKVVFLRYSINPKRDEKIFEQFDKKLKYSNNKIKTLYFIITNKNNITKKNENIYIVNYKNSFKYRLKRIVMGKLNSEYNKLHDWKGDEVTWKKTLRNIDNIIFTVSKQKENI